MAPFSCFLGAGVDVDVFVEGKRWEQTGARSQQMRPRTKPVRERLTYSSVEVNEYTGFTMPTVGAREIARLYICNVFFVDIYCFWQLFTKLCESMDWMSRQEEAKPVSAALVVTGLGKIHG